MWLDENVTAIHYFLRLGEQAILERAKSCACLRMAAEHDGDTWERNNSIIGK